MATGAIERITVEELSALLGLPAAPAPADGAAPVVLDVRHRDAWATDPAHIPGAVWLPLDEAPQRAADLPKNARLVVYCS